MAVVQQYMAAAEMGVAAAYLMEMGGNGGKITSKEVFKQAAARSSLPYARPNFIGLGAGGKTCSQCGTNRTPQWREGPEGPKTLCNACGVKRVRQMRMLTDGHKRRPPAAATAPLKTALSLAKQSSGSLTSDSNAVIRRRDRSPAVRRPQRKAAAKAASRTAEFATTGDWPDDEADASYPVRSAAQSTFTDPSGSEDSAALNSDSAEEVAWTPTRGPGPAHTSMPQPPSPFPVVGHETAAAVNLLSMSIHEQDLGAGRAAAGALAARDLSTFYEHHQYGKQMGSPMTFNSAAFAAMVNSSMNEVPGAKPEEQPAAAEELKDALRRLPHGKQTEMALVKERLENSLREEAAANAAVAAVAKILAMKQAAGIRARAAAAAASRDMQRFMAELDEEFSLSNILKKQRT
ncbi:hypothetical protein COCSUDRAFT_46871 [Coccomyxa subellipsoidea C-169]|uniref:GATA-type domain-containing protein n=1 Tax=Coccomyxa subellipsoidea (strain C-169) TaxID=574566 RepID=I0Z1T0_COCSC|nr:hypothetical protein COCSUDRAFT_46871 [Coccomyxa subellipsoidea C-169]EIE24599.1 hypothetical protein COCSUDRAFT_46871 [Coccomyxa subellipsoidea C-169]|eukprot:XP_005649143.1 hypothetical protein COCSUDRAFT_46871 [Coccomyxa subellipsoidea C-169]